MYNINEIDKIIKNENTTEEQKKILADLFDETFFRCMDCELLLSKSPTQKQQELKDMSFEEMLELEQLYVPKHASYLRDMTFSEVLDVDKNTTNYRERKFRNLADALCTYLYHRPAQWKAEVRDGYLIKADKYYNVLRDTFISLSIHQDIKKKDYLANLNKKSDNEVVDLYNKASHLNSRFELAYRLLNDKLIQMSHTNWTANKAIYSELDMDIAQYQLYQISSQIAKMRKIQNTLYDRKIKSANPYLYNFFGKPMKKKDIKKINEENLEK